MKIILFVCLTIITLSGCNYVVVDKDEVDKKVNEVVERAYFEGQKDAVKGNVRIYMNCDSFYEWKLSPWDDGSPPSFKPTMLDTKGDAVANFK